MFIIPSLSSRFLLPEPVLSGILHNEERRLSLAGLGRHTSGSAQSVNLLVVALDSLELQPRHAAQSVGALGAALWCRAIRNALTLDVSVVSLATSEKEQWYACGGELVVARDSVLLYVLSEVHVLGESDGRNRGKHRGGAHSVAGYVVEGCVGTL